jgi:pimeloyl-ACP methyl ester carboxylesterase
VSSVELGQGVEQGLAALNILSTKPQFLGRVQPYAICLPSTYVPGRKLPLTLLLHSLALGQSQFAAIDPRLLHEVCEGRDSVVVTPLARGPSTWYFDTGELDVWEVWARVAEQLGTDPNRTVVSGYSMGGYAAYKFGLTYPEVFAQAVVLAGPPTCGVRLLPDIDIPADLDPDSPFAREGDTWKLLVNARWLPYVIAHGLLDELVPFASAAEQVLELDRLGYRYRFTVYPLEITSRGCFRTRVRGSDRSPWEPACAKLIRDISPSPGIRSWCRPSWVSGPIGRAVVVGTTADHRRRRAAEPSRKSTRGRACPAGPHAHRCASSRCRAQPRPVAGVYKRADWRVGLLVDPLPYLTLRLTGVAGLTVDLRRAGLASLTSSTVTVATDSAAQITLDGLPAGLQVRLDGQPAGPTVAVSPGRHRITLGEQESQRSR